MHENTLETLKKLLAKRFNFDVKDITLDTTIVSLGLDSLAVVELAFYIEEYYDIIINDDLKNIKTVADLVTVVDAHKDGGAKK